MHLLIHHTCRFSNISSASLREFEDELIVFPLEISHTLCKCIDSNPEVFYKFKDETPFHKIEVEVQCERDTRGLS